jgi:hypothetical protein
MRTGRTKARFTQEALDAALRRIQAGEGLREVARTSGIPKTTLIRYRDEAISVEHPRKRDRDSDAHADPLLLSPVKKRALGRHPVLMEAEEAVLVARIYHAQQANMPISRHFLIREANALLQARQGYVLRDTEVVGESWCRSFLSRHSSISVRIPEVLDASRSMYTNPAVAQIHFDKLKSLLYEKKLFGDTTRIWNVDETGLTLGKTRGTKVLAARGSRRVWQKASTDTRHVSMIFAVSASGVKSNPVFLLPCKRLPALFMKQMPRQDWAAMCTGSGWIKTDSFLGWFRSWVAFLDTHVRASNLEEEHLLIMDQHATHLSYELLTYAEQHHVILYYLPPHTTHYLQPVDVALFRPLKRAYHEAEDQTLLYGRTATLYDIPKLFLVAWNKACIAKNIASGFRATGICPFDPDYVLRTLQQDSAAVDGNDAPGETLVHAIPEKSDGFEVAPHEEWLEHQSKKRGGWGDFFCGPVSAAEYFTKEKAKARAKKKKEQESANRRRGAEIRKVHRERRKQIEHRKRAAEKENVSAPDDPTRYKDIEE